MGKRRFAVSSGIAMIWVILVASGTVRAQQAGTLSEADQLRVDRRYKEAIAKYEEVLNEFPRNGPALYGLGICHTTLGLAEKGTASLEKARTYLEKLAREVPNYAEYRHYFGYCTMVIAQRKTGEKAERDRLLASAEKEVLKALDIEKEEGKKGTYRTTLGNIYMEMGKHAEAKKIFTEIVAVNPTEWSWFWLAEAEKGLGNENAAVDAYLKAVAANPNFRNALSSLSAISARLRGEGKHAEDARLLERLAACRPEGFYHGWALKYLGEARVHLGDLPGAVQALVEAERVWPGEAMFPNYLGLLHLAAGDQDKAMKAYRRAINKNANVLYSYENLGSELAAQGKIQEAFEVYRDGWITAGVVKKTATHPALRAEAEFYRFLYRRHIDQLEAYRK